ncbi:MAG: SpoVR family protein [Calditrichaeota bacterium]|nr:MAG: SpoVR family protein [Calditrichota bacterium]
MNLPSEYIKWKDEIQEYAEGYGLDFFETIFELITYEEINYIASYGGFPIRYTHWRFGMQYEELSKSYAYGLSKIYEMVINNDPCYAYLMKSNQMVDQKLVMAHVYAHCDFFKNNMYFSKTNRKMIDNMANHATRVERHIDRYGAENVENFIDACLSIENLIDPHSVFNVSAQDFPDENQAGKKANSHHFRFHSEKEYLESFINPPDVLARKRKEWKDKKDLTEKKIPVEPQQDVLAFLLEYAPLEQWQYDVLSIIRDEAYYFAPQGQTKIMNEGWATYWHSKIMTTKVLSDAEIIDYADHHSGTVAASPGQLNPYRLGVELLKDIEERWNKGKFGKDYDECDDYLEKKSWDKKLGLGREKIFEVRRLYNDVMFIDAFLTPEFVSEHLLFTYAHNATSGHYEISEREFKQVKHKLLQGLTNWGQPFIFVEDGNFLNRGELLLRHRHEGIDLNVNEAKDTLKNLFTIWNRPVNLESILGEKQVRFVFDGQEHTIKNIE